MSENWIKRLWRKIPAGGSGYMAARLAEQKASDGSWRENANRWRDLYLEVTNEHGIRHTSETVRAEGQFRKLVERRFR